MKIRFFLFIIILLALQTNAREKFKKTRSYKKFEWWVSESPRHKKVPFTFIDSKPNTPFKHRLTVNKAKGFRYFHTMMNDSLEATKLTKSGLNVMNVFNGVFISKFDTSSQEFILDFKNRQKVVADSTKAIRYFMGPDKPKKKKGFFRRVFT